MPLPIVYNNKASELVNYNYDDIADKTGVRSFYLAQNKYNPSLNWATGTFGRLLTTNAIYSSRKEEVSAGIAYASGAYMGYDKDYDLTAFAAPATIQGTAVVQIGFGIDSAGPENNACSGAFIARIRKWDGTTETEIASGASETVVTGTANAEASAYACVPITIPQHSFKIGEVLRLTIEGWGYFNQSNGGTFFMGCDPQNRAGSHIDGTTIPTKSVLYLPFKLDL